MRQHARSGLAGACETNDADRFDGFRQKQPNLSWFTRKAHRWPAVLSSGLKTPWKTPGPLPCGNSAACRPTCCCIGPCWPLPATMDTAFSTSDAQRRVRGLTNSNHSAGAKPAPLNWYTIDLHGKETGTTGDEKSKFGKAIEYWQKLPVPITRLVGPMIRRHIAL